MSNLKDNTLVKVIAVIILMVGVWTIGYLSGLEIGQKRAEQNFSQTNQEAANQKDAQLLPRIPQVPANQGSASNNQLPQIPAVTE